MSVSDSKLEISVYIPPEASVVGKTAGGSSMKKETLRELVTLPVLRSHTYAEGRLVAVVADEKFCGVPLNVHQSSRADDPQV